ncbi:GntR family transcriptional regulator [Streptomyces sp. NPDC050538]|uniref:GntR family transcriptional regulator n=1 Tax=Streptomyces sp. NPDC050538 TaxID=3365627 RepID=UPI003797EA37
MSSGEWVSSSVPYVVPREKGEGDAWQDEAAAKGGVGSQRIVRAGEVPAPSEVAALLLIGDGADVVVRQRVIYLDDQPTELTDTYYPVDVAGGTRLEGTAKIRGGAVTLLAELGYTAHRVREEVSARMPTEAEQQVLVLTDAEPVLCMTRVTLNADGRPFQVDTSVFPASGQRLRYELEPRI